MGGDLASIEDDTFQEVVWQIIQKSDFGEAWIGLNDKRQYNQYEWSDQIPVSNLIKNLKFISKKSIKFFFELVLKHLFKKCMVLCKTKKKAIQ